MQQPAPSRNALAVQCLARAAQGWVFGRCESGAERLGRWHSRAGESAAAEVGAEAARDDAADIDASRNGDEHAYARLIRRYQQRIADQMRRFTRDPGLLEELVHEVFVQAYLSLGSYRGEAPLEHWLSRIAVRVGYRHWKQRSRSGSVGGDGQLAELGREDPDRLGEQERRELVHRMLERLRPADRLVLTLVHLEQRPVAEVAAMTGWSRPAVKVRAHRARHRLGKLLEEHGVT